MSKKPDTRISKKAAERSAKIRTDYVIQHKLGDLTPSEERFARSYLEHSGLLDHRQLRGSTHKGRETADVATDELTARLQKFREAKTSKNVKAMVQCCIEAAISAELYRSQEEGISPKGAFERALENFDENTLPMPKALKGRVITALEELKDSTLAKGYNVRMDKELDHKSCKRDPQAVLGRMSEYMGAFANRVNLNQKAIEPKRQEAKVTKQAEQPNNSRRSAPEPPTRMTKQEQAMAESLSRIADAFARKGASPATTTAGVQLENTVASRVGVQQNQTTARTH